MLKKITAFLAAALLACVASAQDRISGIAEFDKTIYDFGDVMTTDGPLSCTFNVKNIGTRPMLIHSVVTSCGCTDVKWTREPVLPGKTGTISATYTNDEGPYPFDKGLTVYISGIGKPVVLRLKGVSHDKRLTLEEMYPVKIGSLGMKDLDIKCGNIEQGESRSTEVTVANLSSSPATVRFGDVSDCLTLRMNPETIPPRSTAKIYITVKSDRSLWGKNTYTAVPVVNGRRYPAVSDGRTGSGDGRISVYAFTKENFGQMSAADKEKASKPMFDSSSYSFGKIKAGTPVDATFSFKNIGKDDFIVYKTDVDARSYQVSSIPAVRCGYEGSFKVHLDTSGMPSGETLVIVTLTTNSPSRPIVNLFITGWIE